MKRLLLKLVGGKRKDSSNPPDLAKQPADSPADDHPPNAADAAIANEDVAARAEDEERRVVLPTGEDDTGERVRVVRHHVQIGWPTDAEGGVTGQRLAKANRGDPFKRRYQLL